MEGPLEQNESNTIIDIDNGEIYNKKTQRGGPE